MNLKNQLGKKGGDGVFTGDLSTVVTNLFKKKA